MKILFFSDAHGACDSMDRLREHVERIDPACVAFLGDALYHGPRNRMLTDYNPLRVAEIFNSMKNRMIAVRGNCDSEVDQMVIGFPILSEFSNLFVEGRRFFLSHGHHWNSENLPGIPSGSILVNGHTHIPYVGVDDSGIVLFNPGSIALPKENHPPTFGLYADGRLSVRDLFSAEEVAGLDLG